MITTAQILISICIALAIYIAYSLALQANKTFNRILEAIAFKMISRDPMESSIGNLLYVVLHLAIILAFWVILLAFGAIAVPTIKTLL